MYYLLVSSTLCSPWFSPEKAYPQYMQSLFRYFRSSPLRHSHRAQSTGIRSDTVIGTPLRRACGASCIRLCSRRFSLVFLLPNFLCYFSLLFFGGCLISFFFAVGVTCHVVFPCSHAVVSCFFACCLWLLYLILGSCTVCVYRVHIVFRVCRSYRSIQFAVAY